jgi:tRNA 2-thiouridine synthesizing protein A
MELDVRGEMCPYPAMKAKEAMQKLGSDDTIDLLTDHAPALSTVPWEGAKLGFKADVTVERPGEWRIHLERAEAPIDQKAALAAISQRAAELAGE